MAESRVMKRTIGRIILRLSGWGYEGLAPSAPRCVLIAAPHTSNWDFVYMMAMAWSLGVRLSWMGKNSLFVFPLGILFRALDGVPIRRDLRANLVDQCVARFAAEKTLLLAVPAEGTRQRGTVWRSGFYHIARKAEVPIVLGYLDYSRKRGGLGPEVRPSGDARADMDRLRAFYADKVGRHPERFTEPRLAEESQTPAGSPQRSGAEVGGGAR